MNLLKMYLARDGRTVKAGNVDANDVAVVVPCDLGDVDNEQTVPVIEPNLSNTFLLNNLQQKLSHLSDPQVVSINVLLQEYRKLSGDTPGTYGSF